MAWVWGGAYLLVAGVCFFLWVKFARERGWSKFSQLFSGFWIGVLSPIFLFGLGVKAVEMTKDAQAKPVAPVVAVAPPTLAPVVEPEPTLPPAPKHYYSMRDGYEYGYERVLSRNEANSGQATTTLVMLQYAGEKNGKHQVYGQEKGVFSVFECAAPCDFIKVMIFADGEHIKTERMRAAGTLAEAALLDARNGALEKVIRVRKSQPGKKFNLWFDERQGYVMTEIKEGA